MKPRHPLRHRLARALPLLFLAIVAGLLVRHARGVDWNAVGGALAAYDARTIGLAVALTLLSHLVYGAYDLAARTYSGHALSTRRVMAIGFTCYAFGLNLGAVVGAAGLRYRLYSHSGLHLATIARIVAFSVSANWLGYLLLGGVAFVALPAIPLPAGWAGSALGFRGMGVAMLGAALAYLAASHLLHGRVFHVRGHHFRMPTPALALLQMGLAALNWSIMAAIVFVLLRRQVDYGPVLAVLLLAAVASALAHVPAGIGVLEAVFVALLGDAIPKPELLAALLAYRAVYYLGPLLAAVAVYVTLEARVRTDRGELPARPGGAGSPGDVS